MEKFTALTSRAIPLGANNIDTDVIIPASYLKAITRQGLGRGVFANLRADPDNPFDRPQNKGAAILIAGDNFGCGSSREHAPWALIDFGIRVVIAESFADIFASNAFKNGMLLVALPRPAIDRLLDVAAEGHPITVDLDSQTVTTPFQDRFQFPMDPFRKHCLENGLDEIGLTEALLPSVAAYERRLAAERPWIAGAAHRATQGEGSAQ